MTTRDLTVSFIDVRLNTNARASWLLNAVSVATFLRIVLVTDNKTANINDKNCSLYTELIAAHEKLQNHYIT